MKRFATKQPLWHGIWQRHAGFGLYYLTEKFTECLNLFLLSSVQRSNNQCNIIVTSRLCTELPQSHPPGGMSCSWAAFFLGIATVWALCNENRPWAPQAETQKLFQEGRDIYILPCPSARTAWGHLSIAVVPGLCFAGLSQTFLHWMGFNKRTEPNRSLGQVCMSTCPIDWKPWCLVFLSLF